MKNELRVDQYFNKNNKILQLIVLFIHIPKMGILGCDKLPPYQESRPEILGKNKAEDGSTWSYEEDLSEPRRREETNIIHRVHVVIVVFRPVGVSHGEDSPALSPPSFFVLRDRNIRSLYTPLLHLVVVFFFCRCVCIPPLLCKTLVWIDGSLRKHEQG